MIILNIIECLIMVAVVCIKIYLLVYIAALIVACMPIVWAIMMIYIMCKGVLK